MARNGKRPQQSSPYMQKPHMQIDRELGTVVVFIQVELSLNM